MIEQALSLNRSGKMLVTVIDDAHLMVIERHLDRIGLGHNTFTAGALELIIRTADGFSNFHNNSAAHPT